ncbi:MAG: hypothetical protein WDO69_30860 [Pseudomonadota bacterium]
MGAARRLCVRAMVLAGMMSTILSLALPACQFPTYGMATGGVSVGGQTDGGMTSAPGGAASDAGEGGEGGEGGGAGDGGTEMSGAGGAETAPCPSQASCVAGPPTHWTGPIAFWEGTVDASLPPCPQGYTTPIDLHRALMVPTDTCQCTCAPLGQVCQAMLHVFDDLMCEHPCATLSTQMCNAVSGCTGSQGSMRGDSATISGGTCEPSVTKPPPSWQYNARLCQPTGGSCEDSSQVCAPTPTYPYATQLCVMSVITEGRPLPACPAEYPNVGKAFYTDYTDNRQCSECGCSGVTGGSCSGKITISSGSDCTGGSESCELNGVCTHFDLSQGNNLHPTHAVGDYSITPGVCGVATPPQGSGKAEESGTATMVCCQ